MMENLEVEMLEGVDRNYYPLEGKWTFNVKRVPSEYHSYTIFIIDDKELGFFTFIYDTGDSAKNKTALYIQVCKDFDGYWQNYAMAPTLGVSKNIINMRKRLKANFRAEPK